MRLLIVNSTSEFKAITYFFLKRLPEIVEISWSLWKLLVEGSPFFGILYHFLCVLGVMVVSLLFSACGKKGEAKKKDTKVCSYDFFQSYLQLISVFLLQRVFSGGVGRPRRGGWVPYYFSVYTVHQGLYFANLCKWTIFSKKTIEKVWNRTWTYPL